MKMDIGTSKIIKDESEGKDQNAETGIDGTMKILIWLYG